MLGGEGSVAESRAVAGDAERLFTATLRTLPADGPAVRVLLASWALHAALQGHFNRACIALGVDTPEALLAAERAGKHCLRVERLMVTVWDVSSRLAKSQPAPIDLAELDRLATMEAQQESGSK